MANKKNLHKKRIQTVSESLHIPMTYEDIYGNVDDCNIDVLLQGIPTVPAIELIASLQHEVIYAQTCEYFQSKARSKYIQVCSPETKMAVYAYYRKNPKPILLYVESTHLFYALMLSKWNDLDRALTKEETERVFKAYLYCTSIWLKDMDARTIKTQNKSDMLLQVEVPYVEFKLAKDFKAQLYKAYKFFEYLSKDQKHAHFLSWFCTDYQCTCWEEYLMRIFNLFMGSMSSCNMPVPKWCNQGDIDFYDQYIVDPNQCAALWNNADKQPILGYMRNHFMLGAYDGEYMLLNVNLMVDKMFQGLKFDLYQSIIDHGGTNHKNKAFKDKPSVHSYFAERFSEPILLYELLRDTFKGATCVKTGAELKKVFVDGEPDFYVRINKDLYLIEYKDVTLGDTIKYSSNLQLIKDEICARLCKDDGSVKKGAGQLLFNIDRIMNGGIMDSIDPDVKSVDRIFPILLTTDRTFSSMGVNDTIIEAYNKVLPKYSFGSYFLSIPIILEYDTLFELSGHIINGRLHFGQLLWDYLLFISGNHIPLYSFVKDNYRNKLPQQFTEADINRMLGPLTQAFASFAQKRGISANLL